MRYGNENTEVMVVQMMMMKDGEKFDSVTTYIPSKSKSWSGKRCKVVQEDTSQTLTEELKNKPQKNRCNINRRLQLLKRELGNVETEGGEDSWGAT